MDITVELKELQKMRADLEKSIEQIRKFWRKNDDGDVLSDKTLIAINIIDEAIADIECWLIDYMVEERLDQAKLERWKAWATG